MKSKSRRSLLMKRRLSFRVKRRSHCDSDQFEFDNVNPALTAMKSAKKCAAASEFLFFLLNLFFFYIFSFPSSKSSSWLLGLAGRIIPGPQNISWYATIFCCEKSTIWWPKTRDENNVRRLTQREPQSSPKEEYISKLIGNIACIYAGLIT